MKAVKAHLKDTELTLVFNGAAMFDIEEAFGSSTEMIDRINLKGKVGLENLSKAIGILAEQGELVRRYYGYDSQEIPKENMIKVMIGPADIPELRYAVVNAVTIGYGREITDEEETDLGLIELSQKKTRSLAGRIT